jgi:hypothetical protein
LHLQLTCVYSDRRNHVKTRGKSFLAKMCLDRRPGGAGVPREDGSSARLGAVHGHCRNASSSLPEPGITTRSRAVPGGTLNVAGNAHHVHRRCR